MRALKLDLSVASSVRHDRQASAANGSTVDLSGYEGALALLDVAALGGTSGPTATYQLQESDDDSAFNAVASADLGGDSQPAAFSAAGTVTLGYYGSKRYLRWALTNLSGSTPTVTASGTIVRGSARHQPAGVTQTP
jgi:hypothetical protein